MNSWHWNKKCGPEQKEPTLGLSMLELRDLKLAGLPDIEEWESFVGADDEATSRASKILIHLTSGISDMLEQNITMS